MDRRYTQEEIDSVATELLTQLPRQQGATLLALSGDLGAGKTTLVQAIAKLLGVTEQLVSPTFVIAKFYETVHSDFTHLIHIDAYRIEDPEELITLGWETMSTYPGALVVIEWPERIEQLLPVDTVRYTLTHDGDARHITQL